MIWDKISILFILINLVNKVNGDGMGMDDMDGPKEFHPVNAGSKTFHWILTLGILLIFQSIASTLAFANKFHTSLMINIILTGYSAFESFFLSFPDSNDHENKTSSGTSWFLTILLGFTIFIGTIINGSNVIINNYYPHIASDPVKSRSVILMRIYKTTTFLSVMTGWVRVCLAPIALFGFCYGKHTGQCIAHGIMGTAFVAYGFVLMLILIVPWFRNRDHGRPQEFYDSLVMCLWGIVNTFTEHRWGKEPWNMGDYDHTSMGIVWWCGGLVGMWLSRKTTRSFVPSLLLIFTGWSMSQHHQILELSTKVHYMFGLILMGSGASRIIEVLVILKDKYHLNDGKILSFQYFPPLGLILSGLMFMSANEEQLILVHDLAAPYPAYVLTVVGAGFMVFLWMLMCIHFYLRLVGYSEDGELELGSNSNGYQTVGPEDIEQFELGELSSEETPQSRD